MIKEILAKINGETPPVTPTPKATPKKETNLVPAAELAQMEKTLLTVETNRGVFSIRLFPKEAPITCRNFVSLCKNGFYSGSLIHRIIPNKIVQMGAFEGGIEAVPNIPNEFNRHPHVKGTISMARNQYLKDFSDGSQFFVSLDKLEKLDRNFTVFGHVVSGMDIVELISKTPVGNNPEKKYAPNDILQITCVKLETTEAEFTPPALLPPMITIKDKGVIIANVETSMGNFKMRFHSRKAPKLVSNFLFLAQKHFYDGLIWHRIIQDFVIQAGDPKPSDPMVPEKDRIEIDELMKSSCNMV